jgi:3-methyladenine DNA glycosylase/8-oxoguanine DNA glycosylase
LREVVKRREFTIEIKQPFSFNLTVKKPAGWSWISPFEIKEQNHFWSTFRLQSEKLVGIRLKQWKKGVQAVIFSDEVVSEEQAGEVSSVLRNALGADVDLTEFYRMGARDNVLRHVIQDLYGMKPYSADSVFERTLLAICLQMAPIKRSNEMLDCLIDTYGENLAFDGKNIRHWPSRDSLRRVTERELKEKCKLGYRAKFINSLSKMSNLPDITQLWRKPTEEAIRELTGLPGIGKYSAGVILTKNTFPIDVWSSKIFHKLFFGKSVDNPREAIEKVTDEAERRYMDWKWEAFAYVLNDLRRLQPIIERA